MKAKPYRFDVAEARSFGHPVFPSVTKHTFLVQASKLPVGLPTGANAREPVGMNRRVYKDVTESLRGNEAWPGSFDLMNLGITIIADDVKAHDKKSFDVFIKDEDGIVNGAHTAKIIEQCIDDNSIPDDQFVEVRIVTGIEKTGIDELKADIAKGQNTGIAVKDQSIFDIQGVFGSLKEIADKQEWGGRVAWRESDKGDFDVRDLIAVLETMNVIDFPNDTGSHPITAYEKWSVPLTKFADDYRKNETMPKQRKYAALEPLLVDALELYDRIRHDFRELYNEHVSAAAGRLRIVEEAPERLKNFSFAFSKQPGSKYRLTKGAAFPILSAFRNCVVYDTAKNRASWRGGFDSVRKLWDEAGPELVRETYQATRDIGRMPDVLGKNRNHWANLHRTLEVRLLRQALKEKRA